MCGRTALTVSPEDLREAFGLDEAPTIEPHYNIPPSRPLAAVRVDPVTRRRTLQGLRWGLVPRWARDPKIGQKLSLARIETALASSAFRGALDKRRCLIAVSAFYEWQRRTGNERSQPFVIKRADDGVFALAGIWERWVSEDGEVIDSCAILTRPARPPVESVHDRMPVVLGPESWARWLDPTASATEALGELMEASTCSRIELVAFPVSSYVNDPRNDGPRCFEPVAPALLCLAPQQGSLF